MAPVHEKLEVYQRAVRAAIRSEAVALTIPYARRDLQDQLRRASASIPLNIAEGANEFSRAEKARIYRIARRSAAECPSIIDLGIGIAGPNTAATEVKSDLNEVTAMLTTLIMRLSPERNRP